jgi:hypothetical protein
MIRTFARVLTGFVLACLTAGLVQVLFITPPAELLQIPSAAFPTRAGQAGVLALLAATHTAIFSAAFALIAAGIGEWMRIRGLPYYLATSATIAGLGFSAQYASEVAGQPTIFNLYALTAFLTAGVCAGFVFWLLAGRRAGGRDADAATAPYQKSADTQAIRTWKDRPRIVVADPIRPGSVAAKKASLAERLAERERAKEARTVSQLTDAASDATAKTAPGVATGDAPTERGPKTPAPATVGSVPTTRSTTESRAEKVPEKA